MLGGGESIYEGGALLRTGYEAMRQLPSGGVSTSPLQLRGVLARPPGWTLVIF